MACCDWDNSWQACLDRNRDWLLPLKFKIRSTDTNILPWRICLQLAWFAFLSLTSRATILTFSYLSLKMSSLNSFILTVLSTIYATRAPKLPFRQLSHFFVAPFYVCS